MAMYVSNSLSEIDDYKKVDQLIFEPPIHFICVRDYCILILCLEADSKKLYICTKILYILIIHIMSFSV